MPTTWRSWCRARSRSAVILAALAGWIAAAPFVVLAAFFVFFFRDPDRRSPADRDTAVLAPADGRVLVAATHKGIAAVFLGDNDRTLERDLKRDFPAADIARNDDALAPRVKGVLARLYGRKPSALDAADVPLDIVGTAFQWKVWKELTRIPPG